MQRFLLSLVTACLLLVSVESFAQQRFPKPEFESGYEQPSATTPEPRSAALTYIDIVVLLGAMSLAAFFVLRSRSRKGILALSVFSLLYFGFYREGCICSVGSVQNVVYALFNSDYAVSYGVLAFFSLPLLFSLFLGRVFCAGACPLGVIQDLIVLKPLKLPIGLQKALGLFPFVYLGLAVLYAATGTDFIICRYDPFVGIFRLGGTFQMIALGVSFLLIGLFVARPYCRFVCPYSVLLNWTSRFSKYHLSITPSSCIQCKLCSDSCPFDAIDTPTQAPKGDEQKAYFKKFSLYAVLLPLFAALGGLLVSESHAFLAAVHPKVHLANLIAENPHVLENTEEINNIDLETFLSSGQSFDQLVKQAENIRASFYSGAWFLGIFIGLVFGFTLLNQFTVRSRKDYEPNKGDCYSCGRCLNHCPVPKK